MSGLVQHLCNGVFTTFPPCGVHRRFFAKMWSDHPFVVYTAVNLKNGKMYVGATQKTMMHRRNIHLSNARKGRKGKFYTALRKYGRYGFKFLVLGEYEDYWAALAAERQFIKELRPQYNMTDGGGGIKGYRMSDEAKAKMRAAKVGKKGHPCPEWLKQKNALLKSKPIMCVEDGLIHVNTKAAAQFYGENEWNVTSYRRRGKKLNGRTFMHVENRSV